MKKYYVVIPELVNYDDLINRDSKKYEKVNLNIVKGILGQISKILAYKLKTNKDFKRNPESLKVFLCAKKLKYLYGDGYKLALEFLHRDVLYKYPFSKKECFSFTFNPRILKKGFKLEYIQADKEKNRNIIKKLIKNSNKVDSYTKKRFNFLIKFFDPERLKINLDDAFTDINEIYSKEGNNLSFLSKCQRIVDLHNGVYNFTHKPDTDGRFHNNFIRLNKELRKHITYDDKKLVEIDISNSIPFILSSIIDNSIVLNSKYLINNSVYNKLIYKIRENLESLDTTEVSEFHNLCATGELYESLIKPYESTLELPYSHTDNDGVEHYGLEHTVIRKKVKKDFLAMVFARNRHFKKMQIIIDRFYPTILKLIQKMKRKYYKRLSHFLFQIEAYIILERIAREFNNLKRGKVPIFTIHDCIVTTEDMAEELQKFIDEKFSEIFLNRKPKVKIDVW